MVAHERIRTLLLAAGLGLLGAGCHPDTPVLEKDMDVSVEEFQRINRAWRERRLERLTAPYGWLSLTGLHFLDPGRYRLGSDPDCDIGLDRGPALWGELVVGDDGQVRFEAAPDADVRLEGKPIEAVELSADGPDGPTTLEADRIRIHLVRAGDRVALRVRDPEAPSRRQFAGLDYYPLDPGWRVRARLEAHPPGTTLKIANVLGQLIDEPNPGRVVFQYDGKTHALEAVEEDGRLFFIFADRTSGSETYGLGRFLYADWPVDGEVVLDFNQAYNPPCAFNEFTTCPLPPQSNRIDEWVRAGERRYEGPPGVVHPKPVPPVLVDRKR
ncbi:MAG: DUF1684 domain-containing protein [Wenzhouxiangellaceae bacterium]